MAYTTTELLADIKQEGMIPTGQTTWTNAKILTAATRQLRTKLVPWLAKTREGYFVWDHEITLVSGQTSYPLPPRAMSLGLDDVVLKNGDDYKRLEKVERNSNERFSSSGNYSQALYYLKWNDIVLTEDVSSRWTTLVLPYLIRLGELVEVSSAGKITDITSTTITVNTFPATFTVTEQYDFISGKGGYEYHSLDVTPSGVDSGASTLTFASLPDDLAVGDYIALSGYSPIPQIPDDFQPLLVWETLKIICKSMKDKDGVKFAESQIMEVKDDLLGVVTPRVQGSTTYVVTGHNSRFGDSY